MNYEEYIKSYVNRKDSWSLVMGSEGYDNRPLLEKEENLYEEWLEQYSPEEQKQFCMDGLLFGRNQDPNEEAKKYEEAKKWIHAKRRVLFLMKDTNGNPDDDIREWHIGYGTNPDGTPKPEHRFYIVLLKWLWALNEVTADNLPVFNKTKEEYIEATWQYPMAQVNVKKLSGGSQLSNDELREYLDDSSPIRFSLQYKQFQILKPNIIVCGGGSGLLCEFVIDRIYQDFFFEKINDWCYYCTAIDLLVIDSYHPSSRISDTEKFDNMIAAVQQVYKYKAYKESLNNQQ